MNDEKPPTMTPLEDENLLSRNEKLQTRIFCLNLDLLYTKVKSRDLGCQSRVSSLAPPFTSKVSHVKATGEPAKQPITGGCLVSKTNWESVSCRRHRGAANMPSVPVYLFACVWRAIKTKGSVSAPGLGLIKETGC